jgi:large subunit ribosomal protein L13e
LFSYYLLLLCFCLQYNLKQRSGRGFTLEELKEAGINKVMARTIGISVDHRRQNKSVESMQINVQRLKEYKSRLIVFPRKGGAKKGDATPEEVASAVQLVGDIVAAPKATSAVSYGVVTDEMKAFNAYSTLRGARNTAKLVGKRIKAAKAKAEESEKK